MRKHTPISKAILLLLCLTLTINLLAGCGGNTASSMRLERKLGTVGVEDEKDARIEPRDGMQLYSGYEVGTAEESLAWIGLDDSKAVKLDAVSTAEILQSGKKLAVKLHEGKLFFNVSQPLAEDETFTIETATMVTGIRGTSGWMEVVDEFTTRLVVLEGSVSVESFDPENGNKRTSTITGGQILTVVYHGDALGSGSENTAIEGMISDNVIISGNIIHSEDGLRIEQLQEENIPEFAKEEVAQSQQIQDKIEANTDLSVPEILDRQEAVSEIPQDAPVAPPDIPQDAIQEPLPSDAVIEEPPAETQAPTTPPAQNPPRTDSTAETEVYYEEVTVEWYETVPVNPDNPGTSTPGTPGVTPPSGGGTGNTGSSSGTPAQPGDNSTYRPIIQVVSSGGEPQYAIITPAQEVTTYSTDVAGNVTAKTEIQPSGPALPPVPVKWDDTLGYYIEVDDPTDSSTDPVKLPLN